MDLVSRAPRSGWLILVCCLPLNGCGEAPTEPSPKDLPASLLRASVVQFGFEDRVTRFTATASRERNRNGWGWALDVTESATWETSAPDVAAVIAPGRIAGVSPGDAEVRVSFSTYYRPESRWSVVSATLSLRVFPGEPPLVVVQPPEWRVMAGLVRDEAASGISGATVEIVAGHNAGRTAVTGSTGGYQFNTPFVCGPATFHARKAGYHDALVSQVICDQSSMTSLPRLVMRPQ